MLTIELSGAQALLNLLHRIKERQPVSESELEDVLSANTFFVNFYSGWDGSDRETIRKAILYFDQPEHIPSGILPAKLAEGFKQAADGMDILQNRISWLKEIDASSITKRVSPFFHPVHRWIP